MKQISQLIQESLDAAETNGSLDATHPLRIVVVDADAKDAQEIAEDSVDLQYEMLDTNTYCFSLKNEADMLELQSLLNRANIQYKTQEK